MSGDERTVSFAIWPHLLTVEGPAATLGALIDALYDDAQLPRSQWSLGNSDGTGRRAMAKKLRDEGRVARRVGIASLTLPVFEAIERRVRAAGVKCFAMHLPR